ncbi:MAG: oligosaccharide flippase family protein [Paucibacter sp.]|nr:oligosaccharide flippase family protein [Roseateles sp.]
MTHGASTLAARSLRAVVWSYLGAGMRICAQLVIQVGLARQLGPAAFGQASTVLLVMGLGWLLADAGFGSALIQKEQLQDDDLAFALGWVVLLSTLIGVLTYGLSPWLAGLLNDPALVPLVRACAVLIPLQALSNIPLSLLRRDLDMKRQQLLSVGTYVLGMGVVGFSLAVAGLGAWALVVGFGVQLALTLALGFRLAPFPLRLRLHHANTAFRNFGLSVLATNLANWSIESLDRLLVGRFWGLKSLGEYAAAGNLARAPASVLVGTLQAVVFSSTSRAQSDREQVRRGFVAVLCLVALVSTPLFCFLAVQSAFVVQLLYGPSWSSAAPLFAALCLSIPSYAVLSIAGPTLWGLGAARSEFQVQLLIAVATFGGYAALAGWPLAEAVWLVPVLSLIRSILIVRALLPRLNLSVRHVLHACAGGAALAIAAALMAGAGLMLAPSPWTSVLVSAGLSALACTAVLRAAGRHLLVAELRSVMIQRAAGSVWARRACGWLGLQPGVAS